MNSPSKRRWIASVVLSGTMLASSFPGTNVPVSVSKSVGTESNLLSSSFVLSAQTDFNVKLTNVTKITDEKVAAHTTVATILAAESEPEGVIDNKNSVQQEAVNVDSVKKVREIAFKASESVPTQELERKAAEQTTEVSRGGTSKSDEIVSNALRLTGIPYLFGGTTTKGFDCSGFVKYVYKGSGINLPRTSYEQYKVGTEVKKDQLKAGDLVFFSTYDSGASHVGIYIGGGSFIHASRSGIKTTGLSDSYYASRYLGARRVL